MSTPHNAANKGDIAEKILLPGDPLRAKFIADTYLDDVKQFNDIRNMFGYTGTYKGEPVSVMGTGMGMPSMGIYVYELTHFFGVKKLIRVGSAGAYSPDLKLYDIVMAEGACTNSNYADQYDLDGQFAAIADWDLLYKAYNVAKEQGLEDKVSVGNVFTSDHFYYKLDETHDSYKKWADMGVLAVEMETFGLYCIAADAGCQALSMVTISDSLVTGEAVKPEESERAFNEMMEIALEV